MRKGSPGWEECLGKGTERLQEQPGKDCCWGGGLAGHTSAVTAAGFLGFSTWTLAQTHGCLSLPHGEAAQELRWDVKGAVQQCLLRKIWSFSEERRYKNSFQENGVKVKEPWVIW